MSIFKSAYQILQKHGIKELLSTSFKYYIIPLILLPMIMIKIRIMRRRSFNEIFAFTFKSYYTMLKPLQVKSEIRSLLYFLKKNPPKYILEIGTARGGTLLLFSKVAAKDARIISVDLPGGNFGAGYPLWMIPAFKSFAADQQKIILLRKDSHLPSTFKSIKKSLKKEKLDFLFIDGDHSYSGIGQDFNQYYDLVKKGGIIAMHDICPNPIDKTCEVHRFWKKIKGRYRHKEFVQSWKQNGAGIGVIFKD